MDNVTDADLFEKTANFAHSLKTCENRQSFLCDVTLTAADDHQNTSGEFANSKITSPLSPIKLGDVPRHILFTKIKCDKLSQPFATTTSLLKLDHGKRDFMDGINVKHSASDGALNNEEDMTVQEAVAVSRMIQGGSECSEPRVKDVGVKPTTKPRIATTCRSNSAQEPYAFHAGLDSDTSHRSEIHSHSDDEKLKTKANEVLTSPFQSRTGLYNNPGMSLRSDAYLRQALTSPYNQRLDRREALQYSPERWSGRERNPAFSQCTLQWRDTGMHSHSHAHGSSLKEGSNVRHHSSPLRKNSTGQHHDHQVAGGKGSSPAADSQLTMFKTPKSRRWMLASPDRRSASGVCSPVPSVSGSSSGSSGHQHYNPFETGHDRLNFPVFSPTIFNTVDTPPGREEKDKFQWNLEHIAELRPVHIDEKDIRRQMSRTSPDEELNQRVQKAIDYYFRNHMIAPSPWAEAPPPHVLPSTPGYGPAYESVILQTPNCAAAVKKTIDRSCQTTLVLPVDFDIQRVLGEYMTHQEQGDDNGRDSTGSSSLRRKLFLDGDSSSMLSPVRSYRAGHKSPDPVTVGLNTPIRSSKNTLEWEGHSSPLHSPTVQFSSSPIRGPSAHESNYHRTSFPDLGALASPELSPIASKHSVRHQQRFPSGNSDIDASKEASGLGFHVQQHMQIEVHDGSSPREPLSPAVSPIAFFGSDSGRPNKSHTLKADLSASLFASPYHNIGHVDPCPNSPQLPELSPLALPFTVYEEGEGEVLTRVHVNSVSMEMDGEDGREKDKGFSLSARDMSLPEINPEDGEGLSSGFDTLHHHPGCSSSCQDTGYHTGTGSLQTTQEGGASGVASGSSITSSSVTGVIGNNTSGANTSTEAPTTHPDSIAEMKKLTTLVHSSARDGSASHGGSVCVDEKLEPATLLSMKSSTGVVRAVMPEELRGIGDLDDNEDERELQCFGRNVVHSNLTTQFMGLPFRSDNSLEMDSSMLSLHTVSSSANLAASDSAGTVRDTPAERQVRGKKSGHDHLDSTGFALCRTFHSSSNVGHNKAYEADSFSQYGSHLRHSMAAEGPVFSAADSSDNVTFYGNLYDRDPAFLDQMANYLQKGGDMSSEDSRMPYADNNSSTSPNPAPKCVRFQSEKGIFNDSVLIRAKQYLASVNNPEGNEVLCHSDNRDSVGLEEKELGQEKRSRMTKLGMHSPMTAGLSTPTKRLLMGRVIEDLTTGNLSPESPTLASEVAREIMRRAELELRQIGHQRFGTS